MTEYPHTPGLPLTCAACQSGGDLVTHVRTNADAEGDSYEAYLAALEADERRARERRGQQPPMKWGTKLDDGTYFCLPCWRNGHETGAHGYDVPPCELAARGPYDPR